MTIATQKINISKNPVITETNQVPDPNSTPSFQRGIPVVELQIVSLSQENA